MKVNEIITAQIIKALENNIIPWKKNWISHNLPPQSIDGYKYRGINYFLTMLSPFNDPRWLTFKKAQQLGATIKKGSHSIPIVYWNYQEKIEIDENGNEKKNKIPFMKYYLVFNVEQLEGGNIKQLEINTEKFIWDPIKEAENIIASMPNKPQIFEGKKPAYSSIDDILFIPPKENFISPEAYYETLFHELGHSTGHSSRLNRKMGNVFGTVEYSKEELIAEMTSSFLCGSCGISQAVIENQTAYISNWLNVLHKDNNFVIQAAQAAQKAFDYIINTASNQIEEAA